MSIISAARIGNPSLVVCLDSGCANYDQLWLTTSLRGMVAATLTVRVLTEGVHSGDASGIVPSSFRILRQLVSRLEDEATGVDPARRTSMSRSRPSASPRPRSRPRRWARRSIPSFPSRPA